MGKTVCEDGRALDGDSGSSSCKKKRKEGHLGLREFWNPMVDVKGHILRLVSRPVAVAEGWQDMPESCRPVVGCLKCVNQRHVFIFLSSKNFEHESNVIITGFTLLPGAKYDKEQR